MVTVPDPRAVARGLPSLAAAGLRLPVAAADTSRRVLLAAWAHAAGPAGRRHVWAGNGRVHVAACPRDEAAAAALVEAVRALDGVEWAVWNAAIGHLVVAVGGDARVAEAVVARVEAAERAAGEPPPPRVPHPGDGPPVARLVTEIAADLTALGFSLGFAALRAAPLPVEAASAVAFVESQTPVRGAVRRRLGEPVTDLAFALAGAFASALAHAPLALVDDTLVRANLLSEHLARAGAWRRAEPRIAAGPGRAAAAPVAAGPRPVPLPESPAERYARWAGRAGLAGGAALGATGARRAAGAVFTAGLSKAVTTARAAYRAHLHRELARRDVVILDHDAAGRFELVDAVVLGADLAGTDLGATLAARARRAGLHVEQVEDAPGAAEAVRALQRAGRVVAVFEADAAALAAADVAVASDAVAGRYWHADLVADRGWFPLVLDAITGAGEAAHRAVALSAGGSALAALAALTARGPGAARAAADVVNLAALAGLVTGTWDAHRVAAGAARAGPAGEPVAWHALAAPDVLARLAPDPGGERAGAPGPAPAGSGPPPVPGWWDALAAQLANPLTPVLGAGAAASAALGSAVDALLVGATVFGNAVLGAAQQLRAERAVRALEAASEAPVLVRRGGTEMAVPAAQVVPGDLVVLRPGDVVPADCRLVEAAGLEIDESGLTGEPFAPPKDVRPVDAAAPLAERTSMVYAGTTVVAGTATAVAVAVGDRTEAARALALGAGAAARTGVEERLAAIAKVTVPVTLGAAGVVSLDALLRGAPLRPTLAGAVGLVAAALPEGLPLVATTAQLASARRLSARDAIVRAPRTIEALGRVDVLCFDKTGTLTEGEVRVAGVLTAGELQPVDRLDAHGRALIATALRAAALDDAGDGRAPAVPVHSADRALADAADALGITADWIVAADLPFGHHRSFSATRVVTPDGWSVAVKGAPEMLLPRCATRRVRGRTVPLDPQRRAAAGREAARLAAAGYRVLAVAERAASSRPELDDDDVDGLELVGFVALADRIRATARDAVAALARAGVTVAMVTGDHPGTARAVAGELGLLDGRDVLSGPEIDAYDDEALAAVIEDVAVFARVTPVHKVRIVEAYRRRGRVVAMTGDGTNDAGAIRLAHVGIALGRRATPAARAVADVVVADDRLETIVDAVVEGRAMWGSVRDALALLLGGNLGELGYSVAVGGLTGRLPLNARQTLLVNLLTDLLPAVAIASRPPRGSSPEALLAAGPDAAVGGALTRDVLTRAAVTGSCATAAWLAARVTGRRARADTVGLVALVGAQLGQTLAASGGEPRIVAADLVSLGALVAAVQTPVVSRFFGCRPLGPLGWTIASAGAVAGCVLGAGAPVLARVGTAGSGGGGARREDRAHEPPDGEERELGEHQREELLHGDLRVGERVPGPGGPPRAGEPARGA